MFNSNQKYNLGFNIGLLSSKYSFTNLKGFQGQEKDDEIKGEGNSVNYKYRMHDPRIGRFFAVDPLASKYPFYSPYVFSGNNVIAAIELEGLEPEWMKKWIDLYDFLTGTGTQDYLNITRSMTTEEIDRFNDEIFEIQMLHFVATHEGQELQVLDKEFISKYASDGFKDFQANVPEEKWENEDDIEYYEYISPDSETAGNDKFSRIYGLKDPLSFVQPANANANTSGRVRNNSEALALASSAVNNVNTEFNNMPNFNISDIGSITISYTTGSSVSSVDMQSAINQTRTLIRATYGNNIPINVINAGQTSATTPLGASTSNIGISIDEAPQ